MERVRRVLLIVAVAPIPFMLASCRYDWESLSTEFGDAAGIDAIDIDAAKPHGCLRQSAAQGCPAGVTLCESFDAGSFDSTVWSTGQVNASLEVDTDCAYSGGHALRIETMRITAAGSGLRADLRETSTPMSHYFVRMFVFVPSPTPATDVKLAQIIEPTSAKGVVLRTSVDGVLATNNNLAGGGGVTTSTTPLPTDEWACLELEVLVGAPGKIALRLNDQEPPVIDVVDDVASPPPLSQIHIGLPGNTINDVPLEAFSFWMDEVMIDDTPIGCTR